MRVKKRKGTTMIELLVAMSIFAVVSTAVVVLLNHTKTVKVWGDKKNEALRSNREIQRRIGYILRSAVSRPQSGVNPAQNPIIGTTSVPRVTDPNLPPYPPAHVESVDFWATAEDARKEMNSAAYPVPVYPAAGAFDPRTMVSDLDGQLQWMRLSWSLDTGNMTLEMRDPTGGAVLASRLVVNNSAGRNVIRTVDFKREDGAKAVGVYLETRSLDLDTRVRERRYGSYTQYQILAWQ